MWQLCKYPGCTVTHRDEEKDLCQKKHGKAGKVSQRTIRNDRVLDWQAIRMAYTGSQSRLTWVEREIVAGMTLASGGTVSTCKALLGGYEPRGDKVEKLTKTGRIALERLHLA